LTQISALLGALVMVVIVLLAAFGFIVLGVSP
jgi:hypothetical protein